MTGSKDKQNPRVVIVGAGFGGLWAAKELAKEPGIDVTLVDRNNYHTFVPLLYQVAAAELEPEQIAYPIRSIFRGRKNIRFYLGEVKGVDLNAREAEVDGERLAYDYLILAGGSVTNHFGIESVAQRAFGMKDLIEAVELRSRILYLCEEAARERDPDRRRALLTFVVVGGGATGVEFAATLAELVWWVLVKDFPEIDFSEARVILVEAADRLLPALPPSFGAYALQALEEKGIEARLGTVVKGATDEAVALGDDESIPAHTLVWTAGIRAGGLADAIGAPQGRGGRIVVTPQLNLEDHPEVFVVGDMAYATDEQGNPVPQVAPAAIQQGTLAARNIARAIRGEPPLRFVYNDPGTMVTIGRNRGVARIWGRTMRGFLAWVAWLIVHLIRLIGFRNRLFVLTNWAWNYIFYDRAVRLILHRFPNTVSRAHPDGVDDQPT